MEALVGIALLVGGGALALLGALAPRPAAVEAPDAYLRSLDDEPENADEFQQLLAEPFISRVLRPVASAVLGAFGGLLPSNYRDRVAARLLRAGLAGRLRAEELIALQVLGAGAGVVVAVALSAAGLLGGNIGVLLLLGLPFLGAAAPRVWLDRKVAERAEAIRRDLPDSLDLLAISVEAGMGFEGALGVVCDNFDSPLAQEFARTLREMELGLPRREAFHNLKKRTEVLELSNFVLSLTQADALGMPIGRVLKTSAAEMRTKRRQWARERAAKLPVKILFPLVLFIFPALLVVLLGPAAADIAGVFG